MKRRWRSSVYLCVEELETRFVPSGMLLFSSNWSGYALAANFGSVSYVGGSWTVAEATGYGQSATWVGMDGLRSHTVEQIGTESDYVNGQAQYSAWYEMYPNPSISIDRPVSAGDQIFASIAYAAGSGFTLTISSSAWSTPFTKSVQAPAERSSAEWVVEAPSVNGVIQPLADIGTQTVSGATATVKGNTGTIDNVPKTKVVQIDMANASGVEAAASPLSANGSSFTVTVNPSNTATVKTAAVTPPSQTHGNKPGSTHDVTQTVLIVTITVPTANTPVLVTAPIPTPPPPVSTPLPPITASVPASLTTPVLIDPFVGSATSDVIPARDTGRDGGTVVPGGPVQTPPASTPAPMAPMTQPQSRLDTETPAAGISFLQTDGEPAMLNENAGSAHDLADTSERTVEVAGIVLTVALGTSAGVSLGDREARKKPMGL
jgi:hypothetical protein